MNTMRSLFVGLLVLTLAAGALAAIEDPYQTHQVILQYGPENCNWTTSLPIPKFDNTEDGPFAGCYLTSVKLQFDGEVSGFFRFENESATAGDVTATLSALLIIKNQGGVPILTLNPMWNVTEHVDAYDGSTDYTGPSGRSYEDLLESDSGSVLYTTCFMINQFTGTNNLIFGAEAYASSTAQGPGTLSLQYQTNAAVTLTITYTYYCPTCEVVGAAIGEPGVPVTFHSHSTPEEQITEYRWDFGDGNTAVTTEPVVTHIYEEESEEGEPYIVTLCFTHRWADMQSQGCQADLCCELRGGIVRTQNLNWSQIKALYR